MPTAASKMPAEVQPVEAGDEQHRRDDRVGQEPRHSGMQRRQEPFPRTGRFALARGGQRAQRQRDRSAEHQQDRRQHRQQHVRGHVHAEHRGHVPPDTRRRREQQHQAAEQPRHDPARRPCVAAPTQPSHPGEIQRGHDDRRGPEDEVETPVEQHARHRRRAGEVVADLDGGDGRIEDRRRRRRGSAQCDGDAEGEAEDHRLDQRQPDQRPAGRRVGSQCGDAACAADASR